MLRNSELSCVKFGKLKIRRGAQNREALNEFFLSFALEVREYSVAGGISEGLPEFKFIRYRCVSLLAKKACPASGVLEDSKKIYQQLGQFSRSNANRV